MAYPLITVGGRYRDVNTTLDLTNDLHLNGTSPTIQATTSGQSLTIIGGSGTTDDLILRATSGAGASGSDIILQVGNNGATEVARALADGNLELSHNLKFVQTNDGTGDYHIQIDDATTATLGGGNLSIVAPRGGPADGAAQGGTGGALAFTAGRGGAASATRPAGVGGAVSIYAGDGGDNTLGGGDSIGGSLYAYAGSTAAGTGTGGRLALDGAGAGFGNGGQVTLTGGSAEPGTGGDGGAVVLVGGSGDGVGADGLVEVSSALAGRAGLAFYNGVSAAGAAASTGRVRYNDTTKTFQTSADGGAWVDLNTSPGTVTTATNSAYVFTNSPALITGLEIPIVVTSATEIVLITLSGRVKTGASVGGGHVVQVYDGATPIGVSQIQYFNWHSVGSNVSHSFFCALTAGAHTLRVLGNYTVGGISADANALVFQVTRYANSGAATSMAIGGSVAGATAGSVLFAGGAGQLTQDNANLFWDDGNNRLGIGTATPESKLDVRSSTYPVASIVRTSTETVTSRWAAEIEHRTTNNMSDGFGCGLGFSVTDSGATRKLLSGINAIRDGADDQGSMSLITYVAGDTAQKERVRIQYDGKVGIGTSSPVGLLHLSQDSVTGSSPMLRIVGFTNTSTERPRQYILRGCGTAASPSAIAGDNYMLGGVAFAGYFSGSSVGTGAEIQAVSEQAWSTGNQGTRLEFRTVKTSEFAHATRMVIDGHGFVGIGDYPDGDPAPASRFEVFVSDSATYTSTTLQTLTHTTSGTAADGFGIKNLVKLENAAGSSVEALSETVTWGSTAAGPHDYAKYVVQLRQDASLANAISIDGYTTSSANTVVGAAAGAGTGYKLCCLFGYNAGNALTTNGDNNTFVGYSAGAVTSTGFSNVGIGSGALAYNVASGNVAVGYQALTNGNNANTLYNTAIGTQSLSSVSSGQYNTALGRQAGDTLTTGSGNILIGYQCDTTANNTANQVRIGNATYMVLDGWCNADAGGTTLRGFQAAATAAVSDITLASNATRSDGDLLRVVNNGDTTPTKFSVAHDGSITSTGAQTVSVKKISDTDSPYTVPDDGYIISVTSGANNIDISLPSAVTNSGRVIKIKHTDSFAGTGSVITITSPVAGNIDGVASYVIDTDYEYVTVYSDGTNWFIIG